jgi:hypothetical protein
MPIHNTENTPNATNSHYYHLDKVELSVRSPDSSLVDRYKYLVERRQIAAKQLELAQRLRADPDKCDSVELKKAYLKRLSERNPIHDGDRFGDTFFHETVLDNGSSLNGLCLFPACLGAVAVSSTAPPIFQALNGQHPVIQWGGAALAGVGALAAGLFPIVIARFAIRSIEDIAVTAFDSAVTGFRFIKAKSIENKPHNKELYDIAKKISEENQGRNSNRNVLLQALVERQQKQINLLDERIEKTAVVLGVYSPVDTTGSVKAKIKTINLPLVYSPDGLSQAILNSKRTDELCNLILNTLECQSAAILAGEQLKDFNPANQQVELEFVARILAVQDVAGEARINMLNDLRNEISSLQVAHNRV